MHRIPRRPKETGFWWNYEPCEAAVVNVVVGPSERPTWWCAGLAGTIREAVRVTYNGEVFYLDNENGAGLYKVTHGGGPDIGHRSLPVEHEVEVGIDPAERPFFTAGATVERPREGSGGRP